MGVGITPEARLFQHEEAQQVDRERFSTGTRSIRDNDEARVQIADGAQSNRKKD